MGWPSRQDYFLAVQNPAIAFSDPELRSGRPKLTPLGTPWGFNGAFASVYQIECASRNWAVKCFLNEYQDQQFRYQAISSCLNSSNLPYAVGFEYQPQGILVSGKRYPLLKMEWIRGERLDEFVKNNLRNGAVLSELANKWLTMMATLRQNSIAHGDLQHGNVFIVNGELKLIDYDGMFVPALHGSESREMGHRNYQHPNRAQTDFGPHIDNFSAWVIFLSLKALSVDPTLWSRIKDAGDDRILFSKEDFQSPAFSQAMRDLSRLSVPELDQFVQSFKTFVSASNLQNIPPLAEFSAAPPPAPIGSGWITGFRNDKGSQQSSVESAPVSSPGGDWLTDHLPPPERISFPVPPFHESACTYAVFTGCLVLITIGIVSPETRLLSLFGSGFGISIYGLVLVNRFKLFPEHEARKNLKSQCEESATLIAESQKRLTELSTLRQAVSNEEQVEFQKLQEAHRASIRFEQQAIAQFEDDTARNRALIQNQGSALSLEESKERANIQMRIDSLKKQKVTELKLAEQTNSFEIQNVTARKKRLPTEEAEAIGRALTDLRNAVVVAKLKTYRIDQAYLHGIGPVTVQTLHSIGIITAADLPFDTFGYPLHVSIPINRKEKLESWRDDLRARVLADAPKQLPKWDEVRIRDAYRKTREEIESKLQSLQNGLAKTLADINNKFEGLIRDEQRKQDSIPSSFQPKRAAIAARLEEFERTTEARRNAIAIRFQNERRSLEIEAKKIEARFSPQRQNLDTEAADINTALADVQWNRRKVERDLQALEGVNFPRYVKSLILRN